MDMTVSSYAGAVEENERLYTGSFISNQSSTTAPIMGLVNQVKMVWCLQSALTYMSAAMKSLPFLPEDSHPVLSTVPEYMGQVLNSRPI